VAIHFSRLLRHAWVTVGLFLFPGHHAGRFLYIASLKFFFRPRIPLSLLLMYFHSITYFLERKCKRVVTFVLI
jgi:hypothetical protein